MHDLTKRILMARLRKPRNQARVAKDRLQSRCLHISQHQQVLACGAKHLEGRVTGESAVASAPAESINPFSHSF
jgi:hypothetical protein